jgi:hypothetical protein
MAKPGSKTLEADISQSFRKQLYYVAPTVRVVAVPNAGVRTPWAARQAKKEGLATGFPDHVCLAPGGLVAFIEWKTPTGRISDNQSEWIERLDRMGFPVCVARSVEAGIAFLRKAGFPILESGPDGAGNVARSFTKPKEMAR